MLRLAQGTVLIVLGRTLRSGYGQRKLRKAIRVVLIGYLIVKKKGACLHLRVNLNL